MQILGDAWVMIVGWWASYWGPLHYVIIVVSTIFGGGAVARTGYRIYWDSKSRKLIRRVLI